MRIGIGAMAVLALCGSLLAGELSEGQKTTLRMGVDKENAFVVKGLKDWIVTVGRELPLRYAEVDVVPREGSAFELAITFLCDTPDLAKYDTPEKMQKATRYASRKYVDGSVEKAANLVEIKPGGRYGCYATFTDASLVGKAVPPGGHRYVTLGMLRLTKDSALSFRLMSNSREGEDFTMPMGYLKGFVVADVAK